MSAESFAVLNQANANGLRPELSVGKNVPYYEYLRNLRPHFGSLVQPERIENAIYAAHAGYTETFAYPYPQYAKENLTELTFGESHIYDTTPANIPTYKAETPADARAIIANDIWHWAIMKNDTWFATNARSFVYRIRTNEGTPEKTYAWESLDINSICEMDNRLYIGGMEDHAGSSWLTSSRFQSLLDRWRLVRGRDTLADEDTVWGTHWLFYGEAAGGASDIPYYLQMVALGIYGNTVFDKYKGMLFQLIEDGKMGFVPMRHTGEILVIKPLGTRIVAYGREGIGVFGRSEDGATRDWNVKKDIGINARGVVGGTRDQHVFVDSNGNIFRFEENATAPVYAGFSEFMPHFGYIRHSDWGTGEPTAVCRVESIQRILTLDSNSIIKEFNYDGRLMRRVDVSSIMSGSTTDSTISCDGTYVVVSDSVPTTKSVYVLNYDDLTLVGSELLPAGSAADTSKRAVVIAGSWLYLGFNGRVYKYTFPGLVYSNDAAITGSVADIVAGVWGVDDNVIAFVENTKIFFISPTTLATLDSATLTHSGATSVTWVTDWNQYLVNSTQDDVFSLYDSNLVLVRNIALPVSVLNAGGVTALGRRLYLGDTTIPNNYFMIVDDDIIMISYDCLWKEYWISLRDKSYIYTMDGKLGGAMDWSVTSLYRDSVNKLTGIAYDNASGDRQVEIRTVPINFTEHGEKQVIEFIMDAERLNTRRARVSYRNDHRNSFKNSPWVPFSPQGVAFPICSFVDGKMNIKGYVNDNELAEIQRIEVRYIATDLRFRRGTKAQTEAL